MTFQEIHVTCFKRILSVIVICFLMPACYAQNNSFKNGNPKPKKIVDFIYCEAENGNCSIKCKVWLIKGTTLKQGSYVKVLINDQIITEGFILKHISGNIFILKSAADVNNKEIRGGCADDILSINIKEKSIWGC